ncbi:hypothetical protein CFOL_v3_12103 [Cephalotus follicularis]|uniref:GRP domain-containing protein n=1 Tax=Cephalotus follicularis TaxID=3775 RepID=A0A1Q3BKP9_CEPFO|nr:hypothetical protein CFOL_v3_12103 [Cephalotus follicularis]
MAKTYVFLMLTFVILHASARKMLTDGNATGQNVVYADAPQKEAATKYGPNEQTIVHAADGPIAESPSKTGLDDIKNFIFGGVGGFAGVGGYAGVAGLPLLGGHGGIGKYGGIGGIGGIGGGVGGPGGGSGGIGSLGAAGAGGGVLPCP